MKVMDIADNIFFLKLWLCRLQQGNHLRLEASLFLDKYIEDIFFIEEKLLFLYQYLEESPNQNNKMDIYHSFLAMISDFSLFLEESGNTFCKKQVEENLVIKFKNLISELKTMKISIEEKLLEPREKDTDSKKVISDEEMTLLLQPDKEED